MAEDESNVSNEEPKMKEYSNEESMKEAFDQVSLMQTMLGGFYSILTMGDSEIRGKKSFFAWLTPGEPVTEAAFDFMDDAGLMGRTPTTDELKKYIDALGETITNDGNVEALLTKYTNDMVGEDTKRRLKHAANFARLVDIIPDTSGLSKTMGEDGKEQQTQMNIMSQHGTLSQVYRHALETCSVKMTEPSKETEEALEFYRSQIYKKVPKPIIKTDEETTDEANKTESPAEETKTEQSSISDLLKSIAGDSDSSDSNKEYKYVEGDMSNYQDWVLNCLEKEQKYYQALKENADARAEAIAGKDAVNTMRYAVGGGTAMRNQVESAKNAWELAGKAKYEKITALISLLEKEDMATLVQSYRNVMEIDRIMDADSGSYFYYTELNPASFAKSGSWQKFSFEARGTQYNKTTDLETFNSVLDIKGRVGISGIFGAKAHGERKTDTEDKTVDLTRFCRNVTVKFEMCEVNISRPWLNNAFLSSRFWKFKNDDGSDSAEMLSDGNIPPQGLLTAYPVSVIFIRNLKLIFDTTAEFETFKNEYEKVTGDYGAKAGCLWVKASGDYKSNSVDHDTSHDRNTSFEDLSLTVDGMQIIGYRCNLLDKSPNPDPFVTKWT